MTLDGTFKITEVLKKTKAKAFVEVKEGSLITFEYSINGGYNDAPFLDVYVNGKYTGGNYARQIRTIMQNFKYEPYKAEGAVA